MKITRSFVRDPSLVLYLPLYKVDGDSFMSKDAYGHLCVVTGASWTPRGRSFDGSDDNILIADGADSALDLITAVTYEVWVYPEDGGDDYGRFLCKTSASPYSLRKIYMGKGTAADGADETSVRWEISDLAGSPFVSGTGTVTVNAWNHIVGTYNAPAVELFINGVQKINSSTAGTIISTLGGALWVGALFTTNQNFKGKIGEIRIYNRALTAPEIQRNYLATKWRYP